MGGLRVALFVEGSMAPPPAHRTPALERIWNEHIADQLAVDRFAPIVPISKKHLVAMDPAAPTMSGSGERLDQLLVRMLRRHPFDVAVVAWDLVPAWNPEGTFCRWQETLDFYRLLAASQVLPRNWTAAAQARYQDLSTRSVNNARPGPPKLSAHAIVAVCMEPMFEGLLVQDEQAVRRALGLEGARAPGGWPGTGWGAPAARQPDSALLVPAIASLRRIRPRNEVAKRIVGDFRTNKDGWGEYILRQLLRDEQARPVVLGHPIYRRLREWLS
ncbi:MAG: hypothetical protein EA398_14610 [Deltaproteobacteria bacterium]|nr:MAG: hypothetical protein EA398_14610 [Deltaproteobacteria bacterium]